MSCLPHQLFLCTNMKSDDICLEICSLAEQNSIMFTAVFFFFPLLPICTALCWQLTAASSVNPLMLDMPVYGLCLVMGWGGVKVSCRALLLSSAVRHFKVDLQ